MQGAGRKAQNAAFSSQPAAGSSQQMFRLGLTQTVSIFAGFACVFFSFGIGTTYKNRPDEAVPRPNRD
jgi:hypothetical protein